jgi:predicted TIM-barrel fold metal-dependent hydrolase
MVDKLYKYAGDKLPILLHMGDDRFEFSKPARLINVAKRFSNVNFIAAHFGGYRCWDDAVLYKGLKNVYFDTCSSLPFIYPQKAKQLIDMLGAERFFFGTDFPMWDAVGELERFYKIELTEKEREMILSSNIKKLLNIK